MKNDIKPLAERVFDLVKSLSKVERSNALSSSSMSNRRPGKGEKAYINLYKIYHSLPQYDEKIVLARFKGDKGSFKVANRYLRKVLIESLLTESASRHLSLELARKAKEKGFPRFAKHILKKEIERKISTGDVSDTILLVEELEILEKFYLDANTSSAENITENVFSDISVYSQCKLLYKKFKSTIGSGGVEMRQAYDLGKEQLDQLGKRIHHPKTQYLYLKTVQLSKYLISDLEGASLVQKRIWDVIEKNKELFPIEKVINEVHFQVLFFINDFRFDDARILLTEMASGDYPTYVDNLVKRTWVLDSIYLAAASGDLGHTPRAVKDYLKYEHLLSSVEKFRLSHAISVLYFNRGDWDNTILWQGKIAGMPIRKALNSEWIPFLMKAICYFEQGYGYKARTLIEKFRSAGLNRRFRYPSLIFQHLSSILETEGNIFETKFHFGKLKTEYLENRKNDAGFQSESWSFLLDFWLEAKLSNLPIHQVVKASSESGTPLMLFA